MKTCPYCGKEFPDHATVCPIDQTPLIAKPPPAYAAAAIPAGVEAVNPCPACGALTGHKPILKLGSSFSWTALFGGGILAVMLLNAGRAKKVQCNACGSVFKIRPPLSVISLMLFWLLVAPMITFLVVFLVRGLWMMFLEP
jgi:uncharacterized Zn-finger protein